MELPCLPRVPAIHSIILYRRPSFLSLRSHLELGPGPLLRVNTDIIRHLRAPPTRLLAHGPLNFSEVLDMGPLRKGPLESNLCYFKTLMGASPLGHQGK